MAKGGSASSAISVGGASGRAGSTVSRGGFGSIEGGRGGRPSGFSSRELSRFNNPGSRPNLRVIENKNFSIKKGITDAKPGFKPYLAVNNENPLNNIARINTGVKPAGFVNDNFPVNTSRFIKFRERQAANDNFSNPANRFIKFSEPKAVNDNEKFKAVIESRKIVKPDAVIKLKEPISVFGNTENRSFPPNQTAVISEKRFSQESAKVISRVPVIEPQGEKKNILSQIERQVAVKSAVELLGRRSVQTEIVKKAPIQSTRLIGEEVKTGLRIAQLQQEIKKIVRESVKLPKSVNTLSPNQEQGRAFAQQAEVTSYLETKQREINAGKIEPLTIKPTTVRIHEIQQELKAMALKEQLKLKVVDTEAPGVTQAVKQAKKEKQNEKDKRDKNKFFVIDQAAKRVREEMAQQALKKMKELEERRANGVGVIRQEIALPINPPKEALSAISNGKDGSYNGFRAEIESIDKSKPDAARQIIFIASDNNNPVDESDRNINPATQQEVKKVLNG